MSRSSIKQTVLILAIISGALVWMFYRPSEPEPYKFESQREFPQSSSPSRLPSSPELSDSADAISPDHPVEASSPPISPASPSGNQEMAGNLPAAQTTGQENESDLTAVDSTFRSYRDVHGENPIGTNQDITTALFVNNPKQIKLEVPAGSQINGEGQLCDRWSTPYFFHQLSKIEMEIRSAGPDRQMWTSDDSGMK